jgi:hypothetical protein
MMFLDCPVYLDEEGALRCGLPAEVRCRFTMRSTDGLLEAATIRCPSGHWFNGPIESLTWEREQEHEAGTAAAVSPPPRLRPAQTPRDTRPNRGDGPADRHPPGQPEQEASRPNTAPAYYLGRPAWLWLSATRPRHRPTPSAAVQTQVGGGTQPANPAGNTQPEPPQAMPQAATAPR